MAQGSPSREPLGEPDLSLLSAYLDDELSDAERAQVEARLGADAALQAELEALRRTVALVRSLPQVPVPRNFTLDPAQYGRRQTGGWWFSLATPMLTAGASLLVVAVCVGVLLTGGGLNRQAAPSFAPLAGEESVAEADVAAEEAAVPAEEEPAEEEEAPAFEVAEEEEAALEEEAEEAPAPAVEDRVEGAEAGADAVGEVEGELAAESEPLPEPEEEEALAQEAPPPAEEEAPVEETEADAAARQPTVTATPAPLPTPTPPAEVAEAPEPAQLPETDADATDEVAANAAEPAAKIDDAEGFAQGVPEETAPQFYAPLRPSRLIPLLVGAAAVLGVGLLVLGLALTLAKRRR